MTKVAMQPRCIFCKREQYAPAVLAISHGMEPCVWCGKTPPVFETEQQWRSAYDEENEGTDDHPDVS